MKGILKISALLVTCLFSVRASADEAVGKKTHTVAVGERMILLPEPDGFVRIDGLDSRADQIMEAALPASNRYLARFGRPEKGDRSENGEQDREFSAQVVISTETMEIGEKTFAESREETKAGLEEMKSSIAKTVEEVAKRSGKQISKEAGVETVLDFSDVAVLGLFHESPTSLGFTMAFKIKATVAGRSDTMKKVTAAMMVPVNGRLILLYSLSDFTTEADRLWAESEVTRWRDVVVAANPRGEGSGRFRKIFSGCGRAAIIGGVAGGLFGLVSWIIRKRRTTV